MSQKWFNGLNLQQNQLENAVIQNLASDPSSGKAGQIYYNTTDNGYRYHNGTAWVSITAEAVKSIVASNGLTSSGTDTVTISLGTPSASGSGSNTYGSNSVTDDSHTHQIKLPDATDSAKGVIELATDAEATAGTDTTRAINAKQLAAAKQDAINSAKITIQTSDGLTGGSSTPATSFTLGLSNSGVTAGTYNNVTVDAKGRVTAGSSQEYATKTYVDTQDDKKLDKTGGTITGPLTIGGNLTVNGTTTTVNSNTLTVKDKLIEVAKDNTTTLTSPAGLIVPKYNGTDYGALVIDGEGNAKVGDVQLTAGGDIDVNNSDLQTIATRDNLVGDNLVKYDSTNKTLVDSGKNIDDLVTTNTTQTITGGKIFTSVVRTDSIMTVEDFPIEVSLYPREVFRYDNSNNTMNFGSYNTRTHIKGKENEKPLYEYTTGSQIKTKSFVFEDELKDASVKRAETAGKVSGILRFKSRKNLNTDDGSQRGVWKGANEFVFSVLESDFFLDTPNDGTGLELAATGVEPGTYNTVTVDTKGRVTAASNESYATKVVQTITGDGSKTSFDITHTLGADVSVQVYLKNQRAGAYTADELVMVDTYTRNNTVTLLFATAPTTTQTFKVVIIG